MNHAAAPVPRCHDATVHVRDLPAAKTRIGYIRACTVSAVELTKRLEPTTGPLARLRFRSSGAVDPDGIAWEGVDQNANVVGGKLLLHTAVAADRVTCWVDVIIERRPIDPVAERVAREYIRRREGLVPAGEGEEDEQGR